MSRHKYVLKNTLFLYVRMFVILLVSLYTTREVLYVLGVTDFGIYNVVGGFVAMLSFLTSTMSNASTRFFSFELGNDNLYSQRKTFQVTFSIYLLVIGLVILLGETIGLWFIQHKLNVPPDKYKTSLFIYQISLLTLIFNIIRIPYNAAIIAHEKMKFYAYVSIIEAGLKLGIVYCLILIAWNKLELYAILFSITTLLITILYILYATHNFNECVTKFDFDRNRFKTILSFSGWNLTSNLGDVMMDQGLNVLLNLFFGPAVNAARGIAYNIKGVVVSFVGNFQTASSPQITKHYAANEIDQMRILVIQTSKISFFLMFILITPLYFCLDLLLKIWLKVIPDYTSLFTTIILIEMLVLAMGGTLNLAIQASGKIRKFVISLSIIKFICFLIAIIGFKYYECPPEFALWICVLNSCICMVIKFVFSATVLNNTLESLIKLILTRELLALLFSGMIIYCLRITIYNPQSLVNIIVMSVVSLLISVASFFLIGLSRPEQNKILKLIKTGILK